ncbi:MAG TPA: SDR family oxidoreductase [Polyangiaceae bacterium]|jgi:carbonyl reductase 1
MTSAKKSVLVTGGNRGIGLGVCRQLAERGFRVLLGCRDLQQGRTVARELRGEVEPVAIDLTSDESVTGAAEVVRQRCGKLDVLVNNAAVALNGFDAEVARRTEDTNFFGTLRVTDAMLPLTNEPGNIVMVSSGAGTLSHVSADLQKQFLDPELTRERLIALVESFVEDVVHGRHTERGWPTSAYSVSKVSLNALTRILAPKLQSRGILVNSVCPGWVRTDMGGSSATRSIDQGASSVVWAALLEPGGPTGGFFRDGKRIDW